MAKAKYIGNPWEKVHRTRIDNVLTQIQISSTISVATKSASKPDRILAAKDAPLNQPLIAAPVCLDRPMYVP